VRRAEGDTETEEQGRALGGRSGRHGVIKHGRQSGRTTDRAEALL